MDDVSGEVIGEALAQFMAAGARDASATPILMKKGRPGYLVTVIAPPATAASLARLDGTRDWARSGSGASPPSTGLPQSEPSEVDVIIGGHKKRLPVKCGWMDGSIYSCKAEFDTARDLAEEAWCTGA